MLKNKKVKLILVPVIALLSLFGLFQSFKALAEMLVKKNTEPMPMRTCYEVSVEPTIDQQLDDFQYQLKKLEELYTNKKIDDKTYNARKEELNKKIDNLKSH